MIKAKTLWWDSFPGFLGGHNLFTRILYGGKEDEKEENMNAKKVTDRDAILLASKVERRAMQGMWVAFKVKKS